MLLYDLVDLRKYLKKILIKFKEIFLVTRKTSTIVMMSLGIVHRVTNAVPYSRNTYTAVHCSLLNV